MEYLVKMEFVDPGPLLGTEQASQLVEGVVMPSLKKLGELKTSGQIAGGVVAGARAVAFIVNVSDNAELDRLLLSIPLWRVVKTNVTPLQEFGKRAEDMRNLLAQISGASSP